MRITADRPGELLCLEARVDQSWRRTAGRGFLGLVSLALTMAYLGLAIDPQVGPVEAAFVVLIFGGAGAAILSVGVYAVLSPRSGVAHLAFNRQEGIAELQCHSVFRRAPLVRLSLEQVQSVTIVATGLPAFSFGGVLRVATELEAGAEARADRFSGDRLAMRLRMRWSTGSRQPPRRHGFTLTVDGVTREQHIVELALRLAAAADLPFGGVYRLGGAGLEIRLDRSESRGSSALPWTGPDTGALETAAAAALSEAGMPPVDVEALALDHQVVEWAPGRRVELRQPTTFASFLAPIGLLALAAAIGLAVSVDGADGDRWAVIMTGAVVVGLLGGALVLIGAFALPRRVTFDWGTGGLDISTWCRRRRIPFDRLARLELVGQVHESRSEGGGAATSYSCDLLAHVVEADGRPSTHRLFSTLSTPTGDEPWRQMEPVLSELAGALAIPGETRSWGAESTS